jgi:membrane protein
MSLVYTTILSIVPLLAVSLSVLKAFGVQKMVEPSLAKALEPLGPKGAEITQRILEFVSNMKVGVLGTVGLALLVYTVISVIYKIESSLNYIWRVDKPRPMARRFSDYMSILLIGPVFVVASMGMTSALMSHTFIQKLESFGPAGFVIFFLSKYLPYIITSGVFTFLYVVIPSTKVRFMSGLAGGVFAGVLWQTAGWGFARFVAESPKYSAIYSGFAILIIFMIWLYISWLILLSGSLASFYHQNPQYLYVGRSVVRLAGRSREKLALSIMYLVAKSYHEGAERWTLSGIVERLMLPIEPVQEMVRILEKRGMLAETGDEPVTYLPAKDISIITLREVVESARSGAGSYMPLDSGESAIEAVTAVTRGIDESVESSLSGRTLGEMVAG